jgi:NADH:ubiquinone oxidoreductase subunit 3 (subunit A)
MSDEMCGLGQFFFPFVLIILAVIAVIFVTLFSLFALIIRNRVKNRENNYSFEAHKLMK